MLRFIERTIRKTKRQLLDFNTSHVTVYRPSSDLVSPDNAHFNTSHVTVYRYRNYTPYVGGFNFNTSHVTVYQPEERGFIVEPQFQYISCYGLS